jgi:hypothetical protein
VRRGESRLILANILHIRVSAEPLGDEPARRTRCRSVVDEDDFEGRVVKIEQ